MISWRVSFQIDVAECDPASFLINTCAICRGPLTKRCLDCQQNHDGETEPIIERIRSHWMTLMLLKQRGVFDNNIMSMILRHIVATESEQTTFLHCPLIRLPCLHLFHSDCYEKWFRKRQNCPLCNTPYADFPETCIEYITRSILKAELKM